MSDVKNNVSDNNTIDLYKNQLNYERYVEKKMTIYSVLFVIASVVALLPMFYYPVYDFSYGGDINKGIPKLQCYSSLFYLLMEFFNGKLGSNTIYTVLLSISSIIIFVLGVYLVVGAFVNFIVPRLRSYNSIKKMFNLGYLEFAASAIVVCQFIGLLCSRIHVHGNAENMYGFWLLLGSAIVMICTSIPLSTYKKYK